MIIYYVRHGETKYNRDGLIQGWKDSSLTERGILQARAVGKYLKEKGVRFDHALCSDSGRAQLSMRFITDMPFESLPELREINCGDLEMKSTEYSCRDLSDGDYFKRHGGESFSEVAERFGKVIDDCLKAGYGTVLMVSHGGPILYYLGSKGYDMGAIISQITNGCIAVLEITEDGEVKLQHITQNVVF